MQKTSKEYAVERILKHKEISGVRSYLIKWEGYPIHESTWETEDYLEGCRETLIDYHLRWFGKILLPDKKEMKFGTDHNVLFADEDTFTLNSEEPQPLPAFTNLGTLLSPSEESILTDFHTDLEQLRKKIKKEIKKEKEKKIENTLGSKTINVAPIPRVVVHDEEMPPQDPFQRSPNEANLSLAHRPLTRETYDSDIPCDPVTPQFGNTNNQLENYQRPFSPNLYPGHVMAEPVQDEQYIPIMDRPDVSNMMEVLRGMRARAEEVQNNPMWRYDGPSVSRDEIREAVLNGRGIRQFLPLMNDQ